MASSSTTISLHDDNLPRGGHATTQLTLLTVGLSSTSVNGHCTTIIASTARPVPFSTPSSTLFNSPPTGLTSTGTTSSSPMITRTDSYNGVMIFDHSLVQTQSLSRSTSQSSTLSHILRTPTSTSPQQRISIVLPTIPQSDHQEDEEEFANDVPPTRSPGASSLLEMDIQPKTPRHTVNLETSSLCQRNGEASSSFASSVPAVGRSYRQIKLDFLQESEVTLDDRHSTGEARLTALARGEHVHSTFRPEQHRSDDRQDAYENGGAAHESDSDTESSSWSEILTSDDRYHSVWVTEYNSQLRSRDERKRNDKMLQRKFKPQDGADAIVSTVSQRDQTSSSGVVKRMKHEREKAWDWLKANRETRYGNAYTTGRNELYTTLTPEPWLTKPQVQKIVVYSDPTSFRLPRAFACSKRDRNHYHGHNHNHNHDHGHGHGDLCYRNLHEHEDCLDGEDNIVILPMSASSQMRTCLVLHEVYASLQRIIPLPIG